MIKKLTSLLIVLCTSGISYGWTLNSCDIFPYLKKCKEPVKRDSSRAPVTRNADNTPVKTPVTPIETSPKQEDSQTGLTPSVLTPAPDDTQIVETQTPAPKDEPQTPPQPEVVKDTPADNTDLSAYVTPAPKDEPQTPPQPEIVKDTPADNTDLSAYVTTAPKDEPQTPPQPEVVKDTPADNTDLSAHVTTVQQEYEIQKLQQDIRSINQNIQAIKEHFIKEIKNQNKQQLQDIETQFNKALTPLQKNISEQKNNLDTLNKSLAEITGKQTTYWNTLQAHSGKLEQVKETIDSSYTNFQHQISDFKNNLDAFQQNIQLTTTNSLTDFKTQTSLFKQEIQDFETFANETLQYTKHNIDILTEEEREFRDNTEKCNQKGPLHICHVWYDLIAKNRTNLSTIAAVISIVTFFLGNNLGKKQTKYNCPLPKTPTPKNQNEPKPARKAPEKPLKRKEK